MAHILIVEDSAVVVDALRALFEETGHRVSMAGSIAEAVEAARRAHADIMLLDLGLPDGDGLEALAAMQADGSAPAITFALTGSDDPIITERCLAAGCREVLVKPVSARVLLAKLRAGDANL